MPTLKRMIVLGLLVTLCLPTVSAQELDDESKKDLNDRRRQGYSKLYAKKFDEARAVFTSMIEAYPSRWEGHYDMACFHMRQDDLDGAIEWLHKAVEHGCDDRTFFQTDSDLRPIRKERPEEFKKLLEKVEVHAKKRDQERIRERAKALAANLGTDALFPFDFELKNLLEDGTLALSDLKGKVVIVDIWGTWCPPCRMEVPHFVELQDRYRESGLVIVGINFEKGGGGYLDFEGSQGKAEGAVKSLKINYPLVYGEPGILAKVPGFRGFPTTLFLDHEGRVRVKEVGYKDMSELEPIVLALLSEKLEAEEAAAPPAEEDSTEKGAGEKEAGEKGAGEKSDAPESPATPDEAPAPATPEK